MLVIRQNHQTGERSLDLLNDALPTVTFFFANWTLSSASVMSGCSAINFLTSPSCAASANRQRKILAPNLAALTLPVSR